MTANSPSLKDLTERSKDVFRSLVETYLETGQPVGSRTLSRTVSESVSPATIRNVMQDLEILGLLDAPHSSAGRVPTHLGLRMFVDGLMEVTDPSLIDRRSIESASTEAEMASALDKIGSALSGVTRGASLVLTPKHEAALRHIDFVSLAPDRALIVLVYTDGHVENRVFTPALGQTASSMRQAANFINALAEGRTLSELAVLIEKEIKHRRSEIDTLAATLIESGLAQWANEGEATERLIVRGRGNLIENTEDLDRIRVLFDDLEHKRDIAQFLNLVDEGEGVRIFIGSENKLFSLSGSSLVVSPYMNADRKIIGAIGVIGPTRLNYGRIVPLVDYTAQLIGRMMSERGQRTME